MRETLRTAGQALNRPLGLRRGRGIVVLGRWRTAPVLLAAVAVGALITADPAGVGPRFLHWMAARLCTPVWGGYSEGALVAVGLLTAGTLLPLGALLLHALLHGLRLLREGRSVPAQRAPWFDAVLVVGAQARRRGRIELAFALVALILLAWLLAGPLPAVGGLLLKKPGELARCTPATASSFPRPGS